MRISQIREGAKQGLLVEGTVSGDWVDVLEKCWLEAQTPPNGEPIRVDLSGVTYVDDEGRELLSRMIQNGAELRATGVMTRAVIEEITGRAMARNGLIPIARSLTAGVVSVTVRGGSDDNVHHNMFAASADKSEIVRRRSCSGGPRSWFVRVSCDSK